MNIKKTTAEKIASRNQPFLKKIPEPFLKKIPVGIRSSIGGVRILNGTTPKHLCQHEIMRNDPDLKLEMQTKIQDKYA